MADPVDQPQDKHPGGRPLTYKTPEDLRQAIDSYFDMCDPHIEDRMIESGVNDRGETIFMKRKVMTEQKPYTVSGLARHIGLSRQSLLDYQVKDEFLDTILDAKERCHDFAESQLYGRAATGAAFSLKNNWGWKDRQEVDHTTKNQPMPLLAGLAPAKLEVEDDAAQADDGTHEDQSA